MRIAYIKKRFNRESRIIVDRANSIIAEYTARGLVVNLRQLYYQFVARGFLPNTLRSYKNLGALISDARLAGLVDWEAITD